MVWYKPIYRQTGGGVPAPTHTAPAFQAQGQNAWGAASNIADPTARDATYSSMVDAIHASGDPNAWLDPNHATAQQGFLAANQGYRGLGDGADVINRDAFSDQLADYTSTGLQQAAAGREANLAAQRAGFANAEQARQQGFDAAAAARQDLTSRLDDYYSQGQNAIGDINTRLDDYYKQGLGFRDEFRDQLSGYADEARGIAAGFRDQLEGYADEARGYVDQYGNLITTAVGEAADARQGIITQADADRAAQQAGFADAAQARQQGFDAATAARQDLATQAAADRAAQQAGFANAEQARQQGFDAAAAARQGLAGRLSALEAAPQQDISGIANNAAAIQALQNAQAPDISGIGNNAAAIAALQQQLANLSVPPPGRPPVPPGPRGPGGPRGPIPPGLNTPITNTGIQGGGAARPYIDDYFAGTSPFGQLDFSGFQGTQGGGASNYGYTPTQAAAPVEQAPVVQQPSAPSTPTPPPPPAETPPVYDDYGSSVSDEAQAIREQHVDPDLPFDPFDQTDKAAGTSWGGGVEDVIEARESLPEEYVPPPAPAPGTPKEEAHQVVEDSFETFGEALNDPNLAPEEVAAANPAFNPEVAIEHGNNQIEITNPTTGESYNIDNKDLNSVDANVALDSTYSAGVDDFGFIDPFGGTPNVGGGTEGVKNKVIEKAIAAGDSKAEAEKKGNEAKKAAERKQSEILGKSILAAGVSNVGGKFNQSGENQGLKDDWLVVGDSKGGQEVWAPDGKTYESVEAAKKAGGSKDKKKEPSKRDQALKRAAQIAKEMSDRGPSRREQNEINARARAAAEAKAKAAAERQAHLDTLTPEGQKQFKANEAINSRDRGDLKTIMREMGIRYKKDDSSSKLISKLKAGMAKRPAPPPAPPPTNVAPPPRPQVEVTPQREIPPPPQPQVTPAPVAPTPPPPPAPAPEPVKTAPPAVAKAEASGSSGDLKTAIYALRKQGAKSTGSLRKKSKSELQRMLAQAKSSLGY